MTKYIIEFFYCIYIYFSIFVKATLPHRNPKVFRPETYTDSRYSFLINFIHSNLLYCFLFIKHERQ
jgi:hypothetical protein